jgi:hypothetical protein
MAPMMIPGAHQLMPPMTMGFNSARMPPPAVQFLSQMQRVPPPFMTNPLPNQMPQILPLPTNAPSVTDQAQRNRMALPRNPFLHPSDNDALTTPPQVTVGISLVLHVQSLTESPSLSQGPKILAGAKFIWLWTTDGTSE